MNKIIITTAVAILFLLVMLPIMNEGLKRHETAECLEWQQWANEYSEFYLTEWQDAQCTHYGITIDAPAR